MDSICSALAYAELKRLCGQPDVVAARAGHTNERIDFVLEKFGVAAPLLINDLSPRVRDVMEPRVISVRADLPLYDAIELLDTKRLRGLPVVDGDNRCLGLLSTFKVTHHLFPPRDEANAARLVTAALGDIASTLGGSLLAGDLSGAPGELLLVVGAMSADSFLPRMERYRDRNVVLFVGDRPGVLEKAIAARVHAIVLTGGFVGDEALCAQARAAGVTLLQSPHDTATSVLLARGAVRVERMLEREYIGFHQDTLLDEARAVAADSPAFIFPVLDEEGALVGILSKSDFLKEIPRQLILVDHNELAQAVRGAEKVPIVEILDHHKLGGFATDTPILFWNNPVGSTSSIVAMCYRQLGVPIPAPMAGLLMAGLISDTLNLTSPTATAADREILGHLSALAGTEPAHLAEQLFSVGSPLLTMSPEQAINADCKPYEEGGHRFRVAQIEELTFAHFPEKRDALLAALEAARAREGLLFYALLVTDINDQTSLLLLQGGAQFLATIDYPQKQPHIWELAAVVSRKKQLLPYLLNCLEKMRRSAGQ